MKRAVSQHVPVPAGSVTGAPPVIAVAAGAKVNILIVDDEPRNLTVLESILDEPDYRLVRAESGEAALLAMMADEFAVLVLDVRMPDMTGFELAQMVKERRKTARVPIIFLTAYYNEDQHILEGYGSGAVDYLHKPVNPSVLRSKVAVFAELHRKSRAVEVSNRCLVAEVAERRHAESRLFELNESLDRRVKERTDALQHSEAQLRDASRRKDEFLATLAHELRNPLAPVRNAVHILRLKGAADPKVQWAAEMIDRQVSAMSRMIDDLMDVSRINQGKIELRRQWVALAAVLNDAVETSRPLLEEYGHQLDLSLPAEPVMLHVDPTRIGQAFMNLMNNAAKYMDAGGRIVVSATVAGPQVSIRFRDFGIGIAPERLAGVFDMFSQVESALSRSRGGLGIGLALTQQLVEMHGGRVSARSEGLGHGSEFVVTIPLQDRASELRADAGPDLAEQPAATPHQRILVADDNLDAASTLTLLLELMGHRVCSVNDGEAALAAAATFDPDIVLLDIGMPKLNGYEVCQRLRRQGGHERVKVVAISGWGQPEDLRRSRDAGFDHHLVKPLEPDALARLLHDLAVVR